MSVTKLSDWREARDIACTNLRGYSRAQSEAERIGFFLQGSHAPSAEAIINLFGINPDKDFVDHHSYRPSIIICDKDKVHGARNLTKYPIILQLTEKAADRISKEIRDFHNDPTNDLAQRRIELAQS